MKDRYFVIDQKCLDFVAKNHPGGKEAVRKVERLCEFLRIFCPQMNPSNYIVKEKDSHDRTNPSTLQE